VLDFGVPNGRIGHVITSNQVVARAGAVRAVPGSSLVVRFTHKIKVPTN
jgi:hypothetical protein